MLITRRSKKYIAFFVLCIFVLHFFNICIPSYYPLYSLDIVGYGLLMIYWGSSVWMRVSEKRIRTYLILLMSCFLLLYLLQILRYNFTAPVNFTSRLLWYMYYIPLLFVPAITFKTARCIGKRNYSQTAADVIPPLISAVLAVLCVTNDLHQFVWKFKPGFENFDKDYSYGFLFYLMFTWMILLVLVAYITAVKRGAEDEARRYIWIPLVTICLIPVYFIIYTFTDILNSNGSTRLKFQQVYSLVAILFWESFIQMGVIPSNRAIDLVFERSEINAEIRDKEHERECCEETDTGIREHKAEIPGGFVYWKDDIGKLKALNEELLQVREELKEEGELLAAEKQMTEKKLAIKARTELYDKLNTALRDKTEMIEKLADTDLPEDERLKLISVLGVYIKRFSNLSLLAEGEEELSVEELRLATEESGIYLKLSGIDEVPHIDFGKGQISAREAIESYRRFEDEAEEKLGISKGGIYG